MNNVHAFGPRAVACGHFYSAEARPLLIVDAEGAVPAIQSAVEMRKHGTFDAMFLLDDQRTAQAKILAHQILRSTHEFDRRRNAFQLLERGNVTLDGKTQAEIGLLAPPVLKTLRDVSALAERWVVRSWQEYRRLCNLLGRTSAGVERYCTLDFSIPEFTPDPSADAIVVWAPGERPETLALVLFALEEFRRPTYVVCKPGPLYDMRAILVPPNDCAHALQRAALVIDGSVDNPAAALTFLKRDVAVIGASTSGIAEFASPIRTYDPWSRRSVATAAYEALGQAHTPPSAAPAVRLEARPRNNNASVGFIVRTANRPGLLRRALQSIAAQDHGNVEVAVVNNGGSDVAPICNEFTNVTYRTIEKSNLNHAANVGLQVLRSDFVGFLDDDDALFCDHASRLSAALIRSGAGAAYADALNVYLRPVPDNYAVTGFAGVFIPAVVPSSMLVMCGVVGACRMLFRRNLVDAIGLFDENLAVSGDYEYWLRIVQRHDIVRVAAVTSLYTQFTDRSNVSLSRGEHYQQSHQIIYAKYPSARTEIQKRRAEILRQIRTMGGLGMIPPAISFEMQPLLFHTE